MRQRIQLVRGTWFCYEGWLELTPFLLPTEGNAVIGLSENPTSRWHPRVAELDAFAEPLLRSSAVQRLASVTFLGILSPRFRMMIDSPLWPREFPEAPEDGSRLDHVVGVSLLALDLARRLDFSERGQRYAVAWGLTHDIATWPLSHTGEPAFAQLTGLTARTLRKGILLGSDQVPDRFHLVSILGEIGLDPVRLASLFGADSILDDDELARWKEIIHSPLTPDTLEGMWRCGAVFGVPVIDPEEVLSAFVRFQGVICLDRKMMPAVIDFWRSKSAIYERFINREDVIRWESAWTAALQRSHQGITLSKSLERNEDEMIDEVKRRGLPIVSRIIRYKEPQEYIINDALDALPPEPPVRELWRVLRREPVGTTHE